MLDQWIAEARAGRPVWIGDVREGCPDAVPVVLQLQLQDGGLRQLSMPLPRWQTPEQRDFVSRYAAACVYNALSAFSAREAAFYLDLREEDAAALLGQMEEVFQVHRTRRSGYGKVINIADRLCRSFGGGAFSFAIRDIRRLPPLPETKPEGGALLPRLRAQGRAGREVLRGLRAEAGMRRMACAGCRCCRWWCYGRRGCGLHGCCFGRRGVCRARMVRDRVRPIGKIEN